MKFKCLTIHPFVRTNKSLMSIWNYTLLSPNPTPSLPDDVSKSDWVLNPEKTAPPALFPSQNRFRFSCLFHLFYFYSTLHSKSPLLFFKIPFQLRKPQNFHLVFFGERFARTCEHLWSLNFAWSGLFSLAFFPLSPVWFLRKWRKEKKNFEFCLNILNIQRSVFNLPSTV